MKKIAVIIFASILLISCNEHEYGSVTDIDGNVYKTIEIGNQVWMAENLDVSRYRNGDTIPNLQDTASWNWSTSGAWCYYDNDPLNGPALGKMYNGYAILDPRGICPDGWHVPTDDEWMELVVFIGVEVSAIKLKSDETQYWNGSEATNETGFSARPAGFRTPFVNYEPFDGYPGFTAYWTSTINNQSGELYLYMIQNSYDGLLRSDEVLNYGFSCRCVQD